MIKGIIMQRKIKGYKRLVDGDVIPEGAILDEVKVHKREVGFDPSVPFGEGAEYEFYNVYGFILTEAVEEARE